jgi:hypothetical protein
MRLLYFFLLNLRRLIFGTQSSPLFSKEKKGKRTANCIFNPAFIEVLLLVPFGVITTLKVIRTSVATRTDGTG